MIRGLRSPGAGRAKLRLSRGLPGYPDYDVSPKKCAVFALGRQGHARPSSGLFDA